MVKTIKDIVLETYPVKMVNTYGYLPGGDITEKDANLLERMAMEKGANAVLEEIFRFMEDSCAVNFKSFKAISSKIKELKGE